MPRNSSGVFTLLNAAFVPGTTISSSAVNGDLSDIATALSQSLATTGVSTMTGQVKAASGAVGSPGYAFSGSVTTGFYLAGASQIGISTGGVLAATINSDQSATWSGAQTFSSTTLHTGVATFSAIPVFSAGVGAFSTGNLTVTGTVSVSSTLSVTGTSSFTGKSSFTSTDSMAVANGTTAQRNGSPTAGDFRYNSTLSCFEGWNGSSWVQLGRSPTVQRFTSGSGLTYTPSTGMVRIKVRICGGGGGGGASNTNAGNNGADTSFELWTAIHGNGGSAGTTSGGAGGTGGVNGTGTLVNRIAGGAGSSSVSANANNAGGCGVGGSNPFGGAGAGVPNGTTGGAAAANSGGGGAGGGTDPGISFSGSGGGAGEYVEFMMTSAQVGAGVTYTVGAKGTGGAAGGNAGGDGAAGIIIVEEYYL